MVITAPAMLMNLVKQVDKSDAVKEAMELPMRELVVLLVIRMYRHKG
jgi:hypothetical protein